MFHPDPISSSSSSSSCTSTRASDRSSDFETLSESSPEKNPQPNVLTNQIKRQGTPQLKFKPLSPSRRIIKPNSIVRQKEEKPDEVLRDSVSIKKPKIDSSFKDSFNENQQEHIQLDDSIVLRKPKKPFKPQLPLKLTGVDENYNNPVTKPFSSSSPVNVNQPFVDPFPLELSTIKKPAKPPKMSSPVLKRKVARSFRDLTDETKKEEEKERKSVEVQEDGIILVESSSEDESENEEGEIKGAAEDKRKQINEDTKEIISGVTLHDYRSLEKHEFLNDAIIGFYLDWLCANNLSHCDRRDVHVFSSHFYNRLINTTSHKKHLEPKSNDVKAYENVQNWTRKLDLFSKRMVIFPICEDFHWYVIVACNPGCISLSREDRVIKGSPYFLILDSLAEDHSKAVKALRSYLRLEYENKNSKRVMVFNKEKMPEKVPEIPLQQNSCDCGLYLLHYIELIFKNPSRFYFESKIGELKSWFTASDIHHKREDIALLIQSIADEQNPNHKIEFPNLRFSRRKSQKKSESRTEKVSESEAKNKPESETKSLDRVRGEEEEKSKRKRKLRKMIEWSTDDSQEESELPTKPKSRDRERKSEPDNEKEKIEKVSKTETKTKAKTEESEPKSPDRIRKEERERKRKSRKIIEWTTDDSQEESLLATKPKSRDGDRKSDVLPEDFAKELIATSPIFQQNGSGGSRSPDTKRPRKNVMGSDDELDKPCPLFSDPEKPHKRKLSRYKPVVDNNRTNDCFVVDENEGSDDKSSSDSAFFSFNGRKNKTRRSKRRGEESSSFDNTNPLLMMRRCDDPDDSRNSVSWDTLPSKKRHVEKKRLSLVRNNF